MYDIFKTVCLLSLLGGSATVLLLALKPITEKRFSAKWQYYIWFAALFCMLIPMWKFIPKERVKSFTERSSEVRQDINNTNDVTPKFPQQVPMDEKTVTDEINVQFTNERHIKLYGLLAVMWLCGAAVFFLWAVTSYIIFLVKMRRNSVDLQDNEAFENEKIELGIQRKIRLRISKKVSSPLLVGVFFPTVYIPQTELSPETERLVYRHELTHLIHGDLIYKWLGLIVNAIHWFNPFAYFLCSNISQACEVYCDMSVVEHLNADERELYMKTILDLAQKEGGKRHV